MEHYEISLDGQRGIAELRLAGAMTVREHREARDELLERCRKAGVRRILIDAYELLDPPAPAELFNFASGWPAILLHTPVVVAGILPRTDAARRWWRLGEDTAVNRGLISHPFETREEARAWLARW
jgi:hypothetical protein